jgi:hypothetical protein
MILNYYSCVLKKIKTIDIDSVGIDHHVRSMIMYLTVARMNNVSEDIGLCWLERDPSNGILCFDRCSDCYTGSGWIADMYQVRSAHSQSDFPRIFRMPNSLEAK